MSGFLRLLGMDGRGQARFAAISSASEATTVGTALRKRPSSIARILETGGGTTLAGPGRACQAVQTSSQLPWVAALEYSVERFSKKLVCSMPFRTSSIQGSGFRAVRKIGWRPSCDSRRSAM